MTIGEARKALDKILLKKICVYRGKPVEINQVL